MLLYSRYITEMTEDLDQIGLGPTKKVVVPFEVIPNEYLYTSVPKFMDSYFKTNNLLQISTCKIEKSKGWGYSEQYTLEVEGSMVEVDKLIEDFPGFPWVNPKSIGTC